MEKQYNFLCVVEEVGRGYVMAKNEEEAIQKILNGDYEDIVDTYDMKVKSIIEIEEE